MGLIKEPKEVDFYVIDKPWTDREKKEFSEFIRMHKANAKKKLPVPVKKSKPGTPTH